MTEGDFTRRVMAMRDQLWHIGRAILWNDEDAADAVQEAMLTAWKKRHALNDEAKFEAWFMRVFIKKCRDRQRAQIRSGVGEALALLPDALRLPAILFYVEGYSQKETARMLGVGQEQVNTRLRQARRRLKRALTEEERFDE